MKAWMLPIGALFVVEILGCDVKRTPQEEAAVAEIEKVGGSCGCDETRPGKPIVGVNLSDTQVTDAGLEHLKGLTHLYELYLEGTQVADAGLEHLKGLNNVFRLGLRETQVTDAGVSELKKGLPNCIIEH